MNEIIDGRYRLIKLIGKGAFGSVYLAEHIYLKSKVAVKISNERRSEYESLAFKREVRVSARIIDPHIVSLYDFGTTEDGRDYLVREYVEGQTVDRLLMENGTLQLKQALEITLAVAMGLRKLHHDGIIHRDIKPSNIIVPDNALEAKLLDFGVMGKLEESTGVTSPGEIFGTPYYMSPEQVRGEVQSPTVDIYSLGATLYEMIYGKVPFSASTFAQTIVVKLEGEVMFPADSLIPSPVVSFVRRCLNVDSKGRPQSADEVIAEVHKLLETLKGDARIVSEYASLNRVSEYASPIRPPLEETSQFSSRAMDALMVYPTVVAPPTPLPPRLSPRSVKSLLVYPTVVAVVLASLVWLRWSGRYQVLGLITGALFVTCGIVLGRALRAWLKARRGEVGLEAGGLLLSSKSRDSLSTSLAIEVDKLIYKVSRLDDKILATSLAIMVKEFQETREAQFRQAAIMNVVQLLEKLTNRLSPWYVRHEKLVALTVTAVGILSGIITVAKSIVDMTQSK